MVEFVFDFVFIFVLVIKFECVGETQLYFQEEGTRRVFLGPSSVLVFVSVFEFVFVFEFSFRFTYMGRGPCLF